MKFSLVIVSTVCAAVLVTLFSNPNNGATELFSGNTDLEIEKAFINHIAKYGRTYSSKNEISARFE